MSFVFYDTETTGTDTAFDQILQFAAIRTDRDMRELDRFEIRCRLLPYVVPSPGAMRVTGVTVDRLVDPDLPSHYQMVRAIRSRLDEWSPAIFIGHNSMAFDEPLLRQALYKTLHTPYLTNTNGNSRADSLRISQAVNLFRPGTLRVPTNEDWRPTFRLDMLAPANGHDHTAAHDALGDVEAIIHICRIIAERAGDHWSSFIRFSRKAAVLDFVRQNEVFCLSDFLFGHTSSWMVTRLGPNPDNRSQLLVFDLAMDPDGLAGLSDRELARQLAKTPQPIKILRTNACPCVMSYDDMPEHLRSLAPSVADLETRAARLHRDDALVQRLIAVFLANRKTWEPSPYVEERIYDSFIGNEDERAIAAFHATEWSARPRILDGLSDKRLRALGKRLIYEEAPGTMRASVRDAYDASIARRLMDSGETVPWRTLPEAIADTESYLTDAVGADAAPMRDFRDFLVQWADRAGALIA